MRPDKETEIGVIASSILHRSLARNNHYLLAFVNVDVDVDDGADDTRGTLV
jgi:hypothetical protein